MNTAVEVTVSAERLLSGVEFVGGPGLSQSTVRELPVVGVMGNDVLSLIRVMAGVTMTTDPIFAGKQHRTRRRQRLQYSDSARRCRCQRIGPLGRRHSGRHDHESGSGRRNPNDSGAGGRRSRPRKFADSGADAVGHEPVHAAAPYGTCRTRRSTPTRGPITAFQPKAVDCAPGETSISTPASAGGPIVKGKTFFFALWDGFLPRNRRTSTPHPDAVRAQRIFRYYDNWSNGNVLQVTTGGTTPRIAVVDFAGQPRAPATNPGSTTPHNGILRYASVFGRVTNTPTRPDCSDAVVQGPAWDTFRTQLDPTGYVKKLLGVMPTPNNYEVGDGLNTAAIAGSGADRRRQPFRFRRASEPQANQPQNRPQLQLEPQDQRS